MKWSEFVHLHQKEPINSELANIYLERRNGCDLKDSITLGEMSEEHYSQVATEYKNFLNEALPENGEIKKEIFANAFDKILTFDMKTLKYNNSSKNPNAQIKLKSVNENLVNHI